MVRGEVDTDNLAAAVDLASILHAVIAEHADRINAAAAKFPDEPLAVRLDYHPRMGKVDLLITANDRPKPFHVKAA